MSALPPIRSESTLVEGPLPARSRQRGLLASERYRIDHLLGWGGMGLVYEATHLQLDARVALKVLRLELCDCDERVAAFSDEARWLAALSSDYIVRIVDAGQLDSGQPFIAMERLDGRDLRAVMQACGRLAPAVAVEYALQACSALAEAHELGVVHCDVKPSNLFLAARRDTPARIKLLDFGVARALGEGDAARPRSSLDIAGSPSYSSPEQLREPWLVDARADIWSLGLVLFEMLAGVRPFAAGSIVETQARVSFERAPCLLELRPELEPELAAAVARCLQKDRARRWSSMHELADALMPFSA